MPKLIESFSERKARELYDLIVQYLYGIDVDRDEILQKIMEFFDSVYISEVERAGLEAYLRGMEAVSNELGVQFGIEPIDEDMIRDWFNNPNWDEAFRNYKQEVRDKIADVLTKYVNAEKRDMYKLIDDVKEVLEDTKLNAERFVRTELGGLYNKAIYTQYKKIEAKGIRRKYKWFNPMDNLTSPICREIVERTKDGVDSLEELEKIVAEVSMKYLGKYGWKYRWGSFLPHPSCRSRILAIHQKV